MCVTPIDCTASRQSLAPISSIRYIEDIYIVSHAERARVRKREFAWGELDAHRTENENETGSLFSGLVSKRAFKSRSSGERKREPFEKLNRGLYGLLG